MQHDRQTIEEIAAAFPAAKTREGKLDRAVLAQEISRHPTLLGVLEDILHPRVRATEERAIAIARRNGVRAVILDIPLLFETDAQVLCDVVVVAHAPLPHRKRRAFTRAGMTEAKWAKLLDRQLSDHHRNSAADVIVSTAVGKAATRRHVQRLMTQWNLR
jgi:dephospho-CoA kinase